MASIQGDLNEAETKRLMDAFKAKFGDNYKCVQCGHDEIAIVTQIATLVPMSQHGLVEATLYIQNKFQLHRYLPCFTTLCNNCGNVQLFSLEKMGVSLDDTPPARESEDGK